VLGYNDEIGYFAIRLVVSKSRCLKGSSTPAYKGAWRGHHDGTGADTIWSPRLSPICVLQDNPPWACLWIRHKLLRPVPAMGFPATGPPGRQSAIPPPWATLACWFRTPWAIYLFAISLTNITSMMGFSFVLTNYVFQNRPCVCYCCRNHMPAV
jgi:hypothetical protein